MRDHQQKRLDFATYKLLRDVNKNLEIIDMTKRKYVLESKYFTLNLWNVTHLPVSAGAVNEVK